MNKYTRNINIEKNIFTKKYKYAFNTLFFCEVFKKYIFYMNTF